MATAATETVLYSFPGGTDGIVTSGGLISDPAGNVYGVTQYGGNGTVGADTGGGTVYQIMPPASGVTTATENVLYRFTNTALGVAPSGTLLRGQNGALYGTTLMGGSHGVGTVFELSPPGPATTAWSLQSLYSFSGVKDGEYPNGGLIMDGAGALYGATSAGPVGKAGTIFKLTPPAAGKAGWTQKVLYAFGRTTAGETPNAGLLMDASGNLYGSTSAGGKTKNGVVFKLIAPTPGPAAYKEQVIWSAAGGTDGLSVNGQLAADGSGNLYGTTAYGGAGSCKNGGKRYPGCGLVFELSPPATGKTRWTKTTIWSFTGYPGDGDFPQGGVIVSSTGAIFGGTTYGGSAGCGAFDITIGCGAIFTLTPPPAGSSKWTEAVIWNFFLQSNDTASPTYSLLPSDGKADHLFGVGLAGNGQFGAPSGGNAGSVFEIMP